ncbi:MAG: NAD(P)-dependent alcohol dehydrogenase [Propionibacteriaceae bacterium]|nr:NAD(P)-dependent alcohol dehydrogenase [Propionibacteriaceae bacterium]
MADNGPLMWASVLEGTKNVVLKEVPVPKIGPNQVLVQIAAVGVCGSDVHYYLDGRIGDFIVEQPMILGHEASGTIVKVGADVPAERIGQRVSIEPQHVCRVCPQCKAGRYNLCEKIEFYATPPIDGAFADYAPIDADFAYPVPDSLSFEAAALCEPLSVGIWSNLKAGTQPGSRLLIAGGGPIGIIIAQTAKAFGADEVIISDIVPGRRELALKLGADRVVDPAQTDFADPGMQVDAFIDASGAEAAIAAGILAVRGNGRVILVGMSPNPNQNLPTATIASRELILTGIFRYANTWPTAIKLVSSGKVDLDSLVTGRFGLDKVVEALESTHNPATLKSIVVPSQRG